MNPITDLNRGERCYYAVVGSKYKQCFFYSFVYPSFYFFDLKTNKNKSVRFEDIHFKKIIKGV